ncbi:DegT/DnrJ/EryC1/StrS family aminotransferase [Streptomyces sp. NPDC003860]
MTEREMPLPTVPEPRGRTLGAEERAAVLRVLDSAVLCSSFGGEARSLESEMSRLYATPDAVPETVACNSGTAALHLALAAAGIGPGDEVITTQVSDFGTVAPVLAQGGSVVFADVRAGDGNLDPAAVEAAVTDRTKAVIAVHLFGVEPPTSTPCARSATGTRWSSSKTAPRHGAAGVPIARFLLGTDATLVDPALALGVLRDAGLTPGERERVLWRNATELFQLPAL